MHAWLCSAKFSDCEIGRYILAVELANHYFSCLIIVTPDKTFVVNEKNWYERQLQTLPGEYTFTLLRNIAPTLLFTSLQDTIGSNLSAKVSRKRHEAHADTHSAGETYPRCVVYEFILLQQLIYMYQHVELITKLSLLLQTPTIWLHA